MQTTFKLDLAEPHIRRFISEMRAYLEETELRKKQTLASLEQAYVNAKAIGDYSKAKEIQLRKLMIESEFNEMLFEDESGENNSAKEAKGILETLKEMLKSLHEWTFVKPVEFLNKIITKGINALIDVLPGDEQEGWKKKLQELYDKTLGAVARKIGGKDGKIFGVEAKAFVNVVAVGLVAAIFIGAIVRRSRAKQEETIFTHENRYLFLESEAEYLFEQSTSNPKSMLKTTLIGFRTGKAFMDRVKDEATKKMALFVVTAIALAACTLAFIILAKPLSKLFVKIDTHIRFKGNEEEFKDKLRNSGDTCAVGILFRTYYYLGALFVSIFRLDKVHPKLGKYCKFLKCIVLEDPEICNPVGMSLNKKPDNKQDNQ